MKIISAGQREREGRGGEGREGEKEEEQQVRLAVFFLSFS